MHKLAVRAAALLLLLHLGSSSGSMDAELLLSFKATFQNGGTVLSNWAGNDPCSDRWAGVLCAAGRVTAINLNKKGLQGSIPSPVGWALPDSLTRLLLAENALSGTIPAGATFPPALEEIDFGANALEGSIPEAWRLPDTLQTLVLRVNKLRGSFPLAWQLPPRLTVLDLGFNQLEGPFPESWAAPETLVLFSVAQNKLQGSLPVGWRMPPSLKSAQFDNNRFSGTLPGTWQLPSNLTWLDVSNNMLTGTVPQDWALPASLNGDKEVPCLQTCTGLALHNNSLSGTLPTWPSMASMNVFILPGNNGLCGEVPATPLYFYYTSDTTIILQNLDTRLPINSLPCQAQPAPSPAPPAPPEANDSGSSTSTAAIVGGVVGGVAGIALVGGAAVVLGRRRRARSTIAAKGMKGDGDTEKGLPTADAALSEKDESLPDGDLKKSPESEQGTTPRSTGRSSGLADGQPLTPSRETSEEKGGAQWNDSAYSLENQALLATDPLLASIVSKLRNQGTGAKIASGGAATPSRSGLGIRSGGSTASSRELVDVKLWVIDFNELVLRKQIGAGSFGRVYLASWKDTAVAAKLLLGDAASMANVNEAAEQVVSLSSPVLRCVREEASVMAALRHPNVLSFMGVTLSPPCLVSEYCPRGSLYDTLKAARSSPALAKELTWVIRLRMAMGAALGMQYLHSFTPAIIHRDLKSPNLLIGHNWTIKVSDFNLSKIMHENTPIGSSSSVAVGNPRWLAPEVLTGGTHTFASDVFSFGLILWELLTFEAPFEGQSNFWQVTMDVVNGRRPEIPARDALPNGGAVCVGLDAYEDLIRRCWAQDPQERPPFAEIVAAMRKLLVQEAKSASGSSSSMCGEGQEDAGCCAGPPGQPLPPNERVYRSVRLR